MRKALAIIAAVIAVVSLTSGAANASRPGDGFGVPNSAAHAPVWMTRPCAGEDDDRSCFWDARERGNGRGHSFYVIVFPGRARMTCVTYWQPRYAARHDYCVAVRAVDHDADGYGE